jgi:ABC-type Fe3+ transport system permease subunit
MSPLLLKALITLAILVSTVRRGYARRRAVWTRRSWQRFAAAVAGSIAAFILAIGMAIGVDRGIYAGMTPFAHQLYFITLMTLAVASPLTAVGLIIWFANGRPERQFLSPHVGVESA